MRGLVSIQPGILCVLVVQGVPRLWEHHHLRSVPLHCIRRFHLWKQLWEKENGDPFKVKQGILKNVKWMLISICRKMTESYPSRNYGIMVTMFFAVSVINNYALNFNIAMPLHMIFRSVRVIAVLLLWPDPIWFFHRSLTFDLLLCSFAGISYS